MTTHCTCTRDNKTSARTGATAIVMKGRAVITSVPAMHVPPAPGQKACACADGAVSRMARWLMQRGLGLCMRGLVWPSWSATNTPVNFPSGVVDQHHGLLVCGCCLHACGSSTISRNDQSQQRVALLPCLLRIQLAPQKCDVSS